MAARLEVEEDEEGEYGVSLEAPTQTSAAITQSPSHSSPYTVYLLSALFLWLFVESYSAPLNNSNSQQAQTVD